MSNTKELFIENSDKKIYQELIDYLGKDEPKCWKLLNWIKKYSRNTHPKSEIDWTDEKKDHKPFVFNKDPKPFVFKKVNPSNFEKVLEFNTAFGVTTHKKPRYDIFEKDPKLVQYRLDLIEEEVQELKDSIKSHDLIEMIDALSDILYVVYGAFTAIGVDANKAFTIVQDSNMSKLCETEEDAKETVKRYKNELPQRYDSPNYRKSDDNKHFVVFNESTMKILKSYKYTPANFDSLLK